MTLPSGVQPAIFWIVLVEYDNGRSLQTQFAVLGRVASATTPISSRGRGNPRPHHHILVTNKPHLSRNGWGQRALFTDALPILAHNRTQRLATDGTQKKPTKFQ